MGSHNLFQGHTSTDLETSHYTLSFKGSTTSLWQQAGSKPLTGRSQGIFNIQATVDHSPYCSLEDKNGEGASVTLNTNSYLTSIFLSSTFERGGCTDVGTDALVTSKTASLCTESVFLLPAPPWTHLDKG